MEPYIHASDQFSEDLWQIFQQQRPIPKGKDPKNHVPRPSKHWDYNFTYFRGAEFREVWCHVELDSIFSTFKSGTIDQQNNDHHIREGGCEINNLSGGLYSWKNNQ